MTLRDVYKINFYSGGAYRRTSWPEGQYWHFSARPTSPNSRTGADAPSDFRASWKGSVWRLDHPFWVEYNIKAFESVQDDWIWVSQNEILNITHTSSSEPERP